MERRSREQHTANQRLLLVGLTRDLASDHAATRGAFRKGWSAASRFSSNASFGLTYARSALSQPARWHHGRAVGFTVALGTSRLRKIRPTSRPKDGLRA